MQFIKVRPF